MCCQPGPAQRPVGLTIRLSVARFPRESSRRTMKTLRSLGLLGAGAILALATPARADRAEDLARIHVEALGGRERIKALAAMRATGHVDMPGRQLRFEL